MKRTPHFVSCSVLLALLFSCGERLDKSLLLGTWNGVQWVVEGQTANYNASAAAFTFKEDGTYTYSYADALETGTYYVVNKELYTTPAGGVKMMVKIQSLTPDSLVFNMNRGGMAETLTLLKE